MTVSFVKFFHGEDIEKTLLAYHRGLPRAYGLFAGKDGTNDSCGEFIDSFLQTVGVHSNEIMLSIVGEIHRYLNSYVVKPRDSIDEFKLIYFTGMRLAAFLEKDGYSHAAKIILSSMILMLDEAIKPNTNGRGRPELKERLIMKIKDNKLKEDLGPLGVYMIYKCSSNMLAEGNS